MVARRYRELTTDDLNVDYQIHTTQTDGQATISEVVAAARARGLAAIAFTEHVRRDTPWFPQFASDVRTAAQSAPDLVVYVGCEAKALNKTGALDVSSEILAHCDIVLGSVHRFPGQNGRYLNWDRLDDPAFAREEYELALGLLKYAPISVLAHPGGMYQRRRGKPFPENYLRNMMTASIATKVAIEINTSYLIDLPGFLALCAEVNPYISIGSDAHSLEDIGHCRDVLRSLDANQA